jgi:hypothetical protein
MKTFFHFGLAALLALVGTVCAQAPTAENMQGSCGMRPSDWCEADKSDPCNVHHDAKSCDADAGCVGLPYRGESMVACHYDTRGFSGNCPVVGCRSKPADTPEPAHR